MENKKYDFLINNMYILEIDGNQHFPNIDRQNKCITKNIIDTLNGDIKKMKNIIGRYSIVRLYQPNIWNNTYDWKNLILSLKDLEPNTLYIRLAEEDIYTLHMTNFNILYLN